jgi:hypothetical protein
MSVKDLAPVAEPTDVIVGANPTQQVVLVEAYVSQGIPGVPGGQIPEPIPGDEQKVPIVRDGGSGPVWRAEFLKPADIDPASAGLDFRPRDLAAKRVVFGADGRASLDGVAATSAQLTLDANGGGTGWRLTWATGLLEWIVGGVSKLTIAADGAVSFVKGLFTGTVVINNTGGAVPAPLAPDTLISANANGPARIELAGFGGTPLGATPLFIGKGARGTGAAPAASAMNDYLAAFQGRGYGLTGYSAARAVMNFQTSENWTDTAQGASLHFQTTANGTVVTTPRWGITHDGHFIPGAVSAYDLGSAAVPVRSLYAGGTAVINTTGGAVPPPLATDTLISASAAGQARLELNAFGGGTPLFVGKTARGTGAAPAAIVANDYLAAFQGRGWGATGYSAGGRASINLQATENWTDTAQGAKAAVQVTPNGSTAGFISWTFDQDGGLKPGAAKAYDLGTTALTIRSGYFGGLLSVNLGPTPAPAPIDASVGLQVTGTAGLGPRLELNGFAAGPQLNGRSASGTAAVPTASKIGDSLLVIGARGYGATTWSTSNRASVSFSASENWTDTAQGTQIDFNTTMVGEAASAARWTMQPTGHFLPVAARAYDLGATANPVRSGYFAGPVHVNLASPAVPPAPFYAGTVLRGHGEEAGIELTSHIALGPNLHMRRAGGTAAAPTAITNGAAIGSVSVSGRTPSGWKANTAGTMYWVTTEPWTDTATGCALVWAVTPNGTLNALGMWAVENNGNLLPLQSVDIGSPANKVRDIYAGSVTSQYKLVGISAPTFLANIPSGSLIYPSAGASLRAHTPAQLAFTHGYNFLLINFSGGPVSFIQEPGASLYWYSPTGLISGNRTLAQGAMVTICSASGAWSISGTGIS